MRKGQGRAARTHPKASLVWSCRCRHHCCHRLTDSPAVLHPGSRVPELAAAHMQQGQDGRATSMLLDDVLASHLPTSRAPRLHAILVKPGQAGGVLAPMLLGLQRSAQHVAQR